MRLRGLEVTLTMTAKKTPDADEGFSFKWGTRVREEAHDAAHKKAERAWRRLDGQYPDIPETILTPEERTEAMADIEAHDALYRCVGGTRRTMTGGRRWR